MMRTLQRLEHTRPLSPEDVERVRDEQIDGARRNHRAAWWRWCRPVLGVALVAGLAFGGRHWLLGRRIVVDGIVRATTHIAVARTQGRLTWQVRPGQRVRRGDVLGSVEPTGVELETAARRPLELAVEEAELQLELARNRPDASRTELLRLVDELVQAEHEAEIARAEATAARAELDELLEARAVLELTLRASLIESERRADELIALAGVARAAELEAEAREQTVEYEAKTSSSLAQRDLVPANEAELDRYRLRTVERSRERVEAEKRVLESTLAAAGSALTIERERGEAELRRMDVTIEAARAEVEVAERRVGLWSELTGVRARASDGGADPEVLRGLELEVLAVRLDRARAALAEHDARAEEACLDNLVLAEFDAVVDRLLVADGLPVTAGTPLVAYHDPSSTWVEAFVPDTLVERVAAERPCRVMPTSSRRARPGRVRSLGASLVPLPDGLTTAFGNEPRWRLPIEVELDRAPQAEPGPPLRPNLRVKVVVPRGGRPSDA